MFRQWILVNNENKTAFYSGVFKIFEKMLKAVFLSLSLSKVATVLTHSFPLIGPFTVFICSTYSNIISQETSGKCAAAVSALL